jgi:hypothetical protein
VLVEDLMNFKADLVIAKGQVIAEKTVSAGQIAFGEISLVGNQVHSFEEGAHSGRILPFGREQLTGRRSRRMSSV